MVKNGSVKCIYQQNILTSSIFKSCIVLKVKFGVYVHWVSLCHLIAAYQTMYCVMCYLSLHCYLPPQNLIPALHLPNYFILFSQSFLFLLHVAKPVQSACPHYSPC